MSLSVCFSLKLVITYFLFWGCTAFSFIGQQLHYPDVCVCPHSVQAGDLYERIRNNQKALECYRKGNAFTKGKSTAIVSINIPVLYFRRLNYKNCMFTVFSEICNTSDLRNKSSKSCVKHENSWNMLSASTQWISRYSVSVSCFL